MIRITASAPLSRVPQWAILERTLFSILDEAWREFERTFCEPDGRLRYDGGLQGRDGADDFYEPFFNWPTLYRLGGADDLLTASKRHWEGVTAQLTEFDFLEGEYEVGYDWFHQAESLSFFYALCAADPEDAAFRARALRFARLYLAGSPTGNYDAVHRMIVAPHNGSRGPRPGIGEDWEEFRADQEGMHIYGLPLLDVDGIAEWDDLAAPGNARRMGDAMQTRMGVGDTAVNLAATSLAANAWLYDHDDEFAEWITEYVGAWRERAASNGGVLPDNVGPHGAVGELHGGAWYGGHYGWTWPHGLHAVEPAALVAATNALLVSGSVDALELARGPVDAVVSLGRMLDPSEFGSLGPAWRQKLGANEGRPVHVVPYRHGPGGWFDWHPLSLFAPLWIWWLSGSDADQRRILGLRASSGYDWREVHWFHDKEEQGHEAPWIAYLLGDNPSYPERALELAIGQVLRRIALIRAEPHPPEDGDIHWWQRRNPVVTEVLQQLITGAPPAVYYGGLSLARLVIGDAERGRPGLPPGTAALVTEVTDQGIVLELVNLEDQSRDLIVQAGAFGEDRIDRVQYDVGGEGYPGDSHAHDIPDVPTETRTLAVAAARLAVGLPPRTRIRLRLDITRRVYRASHTSYTQSKENS